MMRGYQFAKTPAGNSVMPKQKTHKGTKKRFLGWIGHGLKRDLIRIPHDGVASPWRVQTSFQTSLEAAADAAA